MRARAYSSRNISDYLHEKTKGQWREGPEPFTVTPGGLVGMLQLESPGFDKEAVPVVNLNVSAAYKVPLPPKATKAISPIPSNIKITESGIFIFREFKS